ncbi:MAG: HNH endonuclease [Verrucomicrobiae bacterium]|nr:HNH endonuclease [Verrucomicrobiae bacterium]MCB1092502.1 HNH endonuclease [Verrucomicrobiae bacterium]
MAALSAATRHEVRERAKGACEYCRHQEGYSSDSFAIDHILPRSRGGSDEPDNLSLACNGCNGRKYNKTEGIDSVSGQRAPLFNPRKDQWSDHFQWSPDFTRIIGITAKGRATVSELELNRNSLVRLRRVLSGAGKHPPA